MHDEVPDDLIARLGYVPPETDETMQTRGAKESLQISKKHYSLYDLWQNTHLANYNTKNNPVQSRRLEQVDKIRHYPSRVGECPLAQLRYTLSEEGDIIINVEFPKTEKVLTYNPISHTTLTRKILDEIEGANYAEERSKRRPHKKGHEKIEPILQEQISSEAIPMEQILRVRSQVNDLRAKLIEELTGQNKK